MTEPKNRRLLLIGSIGIVAVLALLPWWRNHGYLRDLYDYGLVIAANGHLNLGERPYVDFTTPIQAGFLGLNWFFERVGGGNYGGLTLGAAALILVSAVGLPLLLARRWPWWAAAIVGAAVTVSAASQHTILWHNALGVIALAFATWPAACAPVARRATWPWHLLAAVALFVGGINKLNFQLVALAVSLAWALRAGLAREAGWGRVALTAVGIILAGVVLPVGAELAWTGATLPLWLHNVVAIAAGSRTGILREILTLHFWLKPIHDYYGPLLLPQVGLVAIWLTLGAVAGGWPGRRGVLDRLLLVAAALFALAAGAALLATNFEIAPLGLGAWLVLLAGVWLGFAPPSRRGVFVAGLVAPALVLGAAAWWSAWLGQRSQFGYSGAPRSAYVPATNAGPAFAALGGLRLPPEVEFSLELVERALPEPDEQGFRRVFYGLGTEWLGRVFRTRPEKGKPLWVHWGTSYGPAAIAALRARLEEEGQFETVFTTIARDEWPEDIRGVLRRDYLQDNVGPVLRRWRYRGANAVDLTDAFQTLNRLGGNLDGRMLHFDRHSLVFREVSGSRLVLGTGGEAAFVLLRVPAYRWRGVVVVERGPHADQGPIYADFKAIVHGAIPEDVRWGARVELPAGQASISVPIQFDGLGKMIELWVSPLGDSPLKGRGFAGYRELEITHSIESTEGGPELRPQRLGDTTLTPELAENLFGPIPWRPRVWVARGAQAGAQGLELAAGGETWLHTDGMTGELWGQLTATGGRAPNVWIVWYKGGRIQVMQHGLVHPGTPFDFHVWTAEPGGWIGILVDPLEGPAPVQVRVTRSTLTP